MKNVSKKIKLKNKQNNKIIKKKHHLYVQMISKKRKNVIIAENHNIEGVNVQN